MAALCAVSPGRAFANLVITPTFDSSITSDPNAAAIEGTINSAIGVLEADISNPINVSVYFQEADQEFDRTGLSSNQTSQTFASYSAYYNLLKAVDTAPGATSAQKTAFASLGAAPGVGSGNPVNGYGGGGSIFFNTANARALGYSFPFFGIQASNGLYYDSVVQFNSTITDPPNPNNGSNYSLKASMLHELDEVLGIGGGGSFLGQNGEGNPVLGPVSPLDLYRYSAPGVRSFGTGAGVPQDTPYAYFSINGGNTVLSYFNQKPTADYGDWYSPTPAGWGTQVQDEEAIPGADPTLGVNEFTSLEAVGYTLAVPEPSTTGIILCVIFPMLLRRRRSSPTAR